MRLLNDRWRRVMRLLNDRWRRVMRLLNGRWRRVMRLLNDRWRRVMRLLNDRWRSEYGGYNGCSTYGGHGPHLQPVKLSRCEIIERRSPETTCTLRDFYLVYFPPRRVAHDYSPYQLL
jgi:hypothetical protein